MIPAKELHDLAAFWTDSGDAFSLYFEPSVPSELSHREETILAKQRIQQAMENMHGVAAASRTLVRRAIDTIAEMDGNHGRSKVIFACARNNIWREYNLPGKFGVRVEVGPAFAIAPLITQQEHQPRYCVALVDREHARTIWLEAGEMKEQGDGFALAENIEKIRTTGARKSRHLERQKEEPVKRRFHHMSEQLLHSFERGNFQALLVGCREDLWPEIQDSLTPELKRILIGHFPVDPGLATFRDIQSRAERVIARRDRTELDHLMEKAAGGAASGGLGAVGLADVADALERNEVRVLLWPDPRTRFNQGASLCPECGHLDLEPAKSCTLCGSSMHRFARADEALVRKALASGVEIRALRHASPHPEAEIGAWLRFRTDQNAPQALAS